MANPPPPARPSLFGPAANAPVNPLLAKFGKSAMDQFLVNERILMFSPPKHGKTFASFAFSDQFKGWHLPECKPGKPNPACERCKTPGAIEVSDMVWVAFDPQPLVGIIEHGYDLKRGNLIDLSGETDEKLEPAIDTLTYNLVKVVEAVKPKAVVLDTMTFMVKNAEAFYSVKYDKWDLFRKVGNMSHRVISALKACQCHVLILSHAKNDIAPSDAAGQANKKATDLPGSGGISSQITGQTKGTIEGMVSMILPMQARDASETKRERNFYPTGSQGFEGAGRYLRFLGKEEPADLKLLFAKIKQGAEAEVTKAADAAKV